MALTLSLPGRLRGSGVTARRLLMPRTEPLPAAYWLTAAVATVVLLVCFATADWVPWFVRDTAIWLPRGVYVVGPALLLLLGLAFGLVMATVPWLAARWPGFAIVVALLPGAVALLDGDAGVHFGMFVALGAVALMAGWRHPTVAVVAVAVALAAVWLWIAGGVRMAAPFGADIDLRYGAGPAGVGTVYTVVLLLVLLGAVGLRMSGEREVQRRTLVARADAVEQESAVVAERARLARDLHDVVAHHVSLIAVRAETAPYTHPGLDDTARDLLGEIAGDARLALDELRGVLGILGRAGDSERSPQPGWRDIPALVTRSREAGTTVALEGDLDAEVPPALGYVAYRVVQESLTNARKHAPGQPVLVRLEVTPGLLTVCVVSAGAGPSELPATGHGLAGMRERVESVGGRLRTGAADGEFRVEATVPRREVR